MNQEFTALLANHCDIPLAAISSDSHLSNDLGLDSLDIVHLILQIEDRFQVSIPDDEYQSLTTAGQYDDYLRTKIATTLFYSSLFYSKKQLAN